MVIERKRWRRMPRPPKFRTTGTRLEDVELDDFDSFCLGVSEVTVLFRWTKTGAYRPATHYDPEQFAELRIDSVELIRPAVVPPIAVGRVEALLREIEDSFDNTPNWPVDFDPRRVLRVKE